ncbi:Hypothetical protein EAG7_04462 [Klebsiella aerogenes]|nr:Hypothetical protein EAG7_04462 [Klebsiella aerogenes]PVF74342.1 hypothetical protein CSC18_0771 [Klebsiella aerogenes]CCG32956.1 hypothetical protein [Klebsiella aerogenes EA1509E]
MQEILLCNAAACKLIKNGKTQESVNSQNKFNLLTFLSL